PLPQRVAENILCNTEQPGKRRRSVPVAEPTSAQPGPCEDFGRQIGGMLANPHPRPPKHLTDVPVIHLRERIGITRSQEFRVRRPSEVASHNLYFAAPRKVCQPKCVSLDEASFVSPLHAEVERKRWPARCTTRGRGAARAREP